jgi:serine/threonine-protein kinase
MPLLTPDRWSEIDALFERALDRPPDERSAFLRSTCGADPALYEAVTALLEADADAGRALGESATALVPTLLREADEQTDARLPPGTRLGPYRVEGLLGQGGMGVVYRATRADGTFERAVALKLVKRGMDTHEVLRRFRYERQILAGLDHPGIARLLDAGAAPDGRPYLVMEIAAGEPLTAYADARRLDVDARLALLEQVAEAVAYAHRSGVVHRDLKPSNILVADGVRSVGDEPDGAAPRTPPPPTPLPLPPSVKLLDFGIARLLDAPPDAEAPQTRPDMRVLTPEYAAPEQRAGAPATTATDVYALGVLLHELLVGVRPTDGQPPDAAVATDAADARGLTPARLRRRLRGDLGTLVLAALHADPDRRYASAEALLDDLRRLRADLPLRARPDGARYRATLFVRRHRTAVAAAAAALLLLVAFTASLAVQQRATARERDRAERELAQKAEVTAFLTDLFAGAAPEQARGDTLTAFDLLARGADRVEADLAGQPDVQGLLFATLGDIYERLGDSGQALALARRSLAVREAHLGPRHPDVAASLNLVATVLESQGHYDAAETAHRRALAIRSDALGPDATEVAESTLNLGLLLTNQGAYADAEPLLRRALALDRTRHGDRHENVATALNNLAVLHYHQGRYPEGVAALREALAIRRQVYGVPHPRVAVTLNNLAAFERKQGALPAAEAHIREALAMYRRLLGEDHADVASALSNLGAIVGEQGRHAEAEPLLREAVALGRTVYDGPHPEAADALSNLGRTLLDQRKTAQAETAFQAARTMNEATRGADHPRTALCTCNLGLAAAARGADREAETRLRACIGTLETALDDGHDDLAQARSDLGTILLRLGQADEAEALLARAEQALRATYGADDARTREAGARRTRAATARRSGGA